MMTTSPSKRTIGQGVLEGLQLSTKPLVGSNLSDKEKLGYFEKQSEELSKGLELIPNELRIRFVTQDDIKRFQSSFLTDFLRGSPKLGQVLIEWNVNDSSTAFNEFNLISKTLLALRLLKPKLVFLKNLYFFEQDSDFISGALDILPVPVHYTNGYCIYLDDKEALTKILEKLQGIDFEEDISFRIACERFNRSYHDSHYEDKLIDLLIGYEGLFLRGSKSGENIGMTIGLACSMLCGQNRAERQKISEDIQKAYTFRNRVVHGSSFDELKMYELTPSLEEYLRRSILRLME